MTQDLNDSSLTLVEDDTNHTEPQHYEQYAVDPVIYETHEDHEDLIDDFNVWDDDGFSWINDWLFKESDLRRFHSNERLYQSPFVQERMQKLADMRKGGYLPLDAYLQRNFFIPIFTDDQGEEYQLGCGRNWGLMPHLPHADCPRAVKRGQVPTDCLYELRTRIPISEGQAIPLPRNILGLGQLCVKTSARHVPVVEQTDYSVVIDVDHEDLPVWIFAPRSQLQDRARGKGFPEPIAALPVFDSLMYKGDGPSHGYYDAACILSSGRRLGLQPSDQNAPNFRQACDLVRMSRASVDPVIVSQSREKLLEYAAEDSIPPRNAEPRRNVLLDEVE